MNISPVIYLTCDDYKEYQKADSWLNIEILRIYRLSREFCEHLN